MTAAAPVSLCLVTARLPGAGRRVLLGRKKRGFGAGRIVGLGGHREPGETAARAAVRELREEAGLVVGVAALRPAATVLFRFPAAPEQDLRAAVFTGAVDAADDAALLALVRESEEVAPAWFPVERLPLDRMWHDARFWLPRVLAGERLDAEFVFSHDGATVATHTIHPAHSTAEPSS